jgi:hypothetical protein
LKVRYSCRFRPFDPFCRINRHLPCGSIQSNGMTPI